MKNDVAAEMADTIIEQEKKDKLALAILLDNSARNKHSVFACPVKMGITRSYLASVTLAWVCDKVKFIADFPLFGAHMPPDEKTADSILQHRLPDWSRQLPMSCYLAAAEQRKFSPLVTVCYQNWVYDKNSEYWGIDERAVMESVPATPLDSRGLLSDIRTNNATFYALDGQHRLMALFGLRELLTNKKIKAKKSDNSDGKKEVTRDEVIRFISEQRQKQGKAPTDKIEILAELENRMQETVGIEIIPAVQRHETAADAIARLQQTFADLHRCAGEDATAALWNK